MSDAADPAQEQTTTRAGLVESSSALVALGAVLAVVAIAAIAIQALPAGKTQSANIVTLATAAFGVLGALAGSYFAVRSADKGVNKVAAQRRSQTEPTASGGPSGSPGPLPGGRP